MVTLIMLIAVTCEEEMVIMQKERETRTKEEVKAVLAISVKDDSCEDRSAIIVEYEDILQDNVKTKLRGNLHVVTIAANPGTQRRNVDKNNETNFS